MIRALLSLICLSLLAACSVDPRRHADDLALRALLERSEIHAGSFTLVAYSRLGDPSQPIDLYIEGDGRAWLTRHRLSDDPTPRNAIGLQLAAADPAANVVYLARPCQFGDLQAKPCSSEYWSARRYSEEVVAAMDEAITTFALRMQNPGLNLIGYSGGAAIAVLLAARRNDVASLRTVAGNLGVEAVNRHHGVDAMPDSLDPADVAPRLASLPQLHFIGAKDTVVPGSVASDFVARAGHRACARIIVVEGATHDQPWAAQWSELLATGFPACE